MTNLKTTLGKIKSFDSYEIRWKNLLKNIGTTDEDKEISLLEILDSDGVEDAVRALRCWNFYDYCLLLADIIEPSLQRSNNDVVKNMSNTIRKYRAGDIDRYEMIAVVDHVATAFDTTTADANSAAYFAACSATYSAIYVYSSIDDAADAADDRKEFWKRAEKLMREFCEKEE